MSETRFAVGGGAFERKAERKSFPDGGKVPPGCRNAEGESDVR